MRAYRGRRRAVEFQAADRAEMYACVERTLRHLDYPRLSRADRGLAKQYLSKLTGLGRAQLTRLIGRYGSQGTVAVVKYQRRKFTARYSEADVRLLAYVDQAHGTLSGPATRRIPPGASTANITSENTSDWRPSARPDLSFSQDRGVSQTSHQLSAHDPPDPHRRAPGPIERRAAELFAQGLPCTREIRTASGFVSYQRGGSSYAMAGGGGHTASPEA